MTAVPGLKRGFEILNVLNQHDTMSLEQIAGITQFPKASILRMLETLSEMRLITRINENKHYRALSIVMPRKESFEQRMQAQLSALAEKADVCVEWYHADVEGLHISRRFSAAENEVQVLARLGFLREWDDELEAVCAVGLAFKKQADKKQVQQKKMWVYDEQGDRRDVSNTEKSQIIQAAKRESFYCDPLYNENGVKRMAAPFIQDGTLKGVVALAMSFRPQLDKSLGEKRQQLTETINQLQL